MYFIYLFVINMYIVLCTYEYDVNVISIKLISINPCFCNIFIVQNKTSYELI